MNTLRFTLIAFLLLFTSTAAWSQDISDLPARHTSPWYFELSLKARTAIYRGEAPRELKPIVQEYNANWLAPNQSVKYYQTPMLTHALGFAVRRNLKGPWIAGLGLNWSRWRFQEQQEWVYNGQFLGNPDASGWTQYNRQTMNMLSLPISFGYQFWEGRQRISLQLIPNMFVAGSYAHKETSHYYSKPDAIYDGGRLPIAPKLIRSIFGSSSLPMSQVGYQPFSIAAGLQYEFRFELGNQNFGLHLNAETSLSPILKQSIYDTAIISYWRSPSNYPAKTTQYAAASMGLSWEFR